MPDVKQIYDYRQKDSVICSQPGPWGDAYLGYCAGMAFEWCCLRFHGKDFEFDEETREVTTLPWRVTKYVQPIDYNNVLWGLGLDFDGTPVTDTGFIVGTRFRRLASGEGIYLLIMRPEEGSAHAVAFQTGPGKELRHFDANCGLYRGMCDMHEFTTWWNNHSISVGYQRRYSKSWTLMKIKTTWRFWSPSHSN
jgi:hypothetical protein